MSDVRSFLEQGVARAVEPLAQLASGAAAAASGAAAAGAVAAGTSMQVTHAVATSLTATLLALPDKLRELELPSAKQRIEEVSEQLHSLAGRLRRSSGHLGLAGTRLGEPALQGSGKLIADGFAVSAQVLGLLRPREQGLVRFVPRELSRPYLDGLGTLQVGLNAAGDLVRLIASSLPSLSQGLGDIGTDLASAADLLDATADTLRDLSKLAPV